MAETSPLTNAIVIGCGFAGLSVAIELAKRGVKVVVFDSAPDMKRQGIYASLYDLLSRHIEDSPRIHVLTVERGRDPDSCKRNPANGIMGRHTRRHQEHFSYARNSIYHETRWQSSP